VGSNPTLSAINFQELDGSQQNYLSEIAQSG